MSPSIRELLASALGELPPSTPAQSPSQPASVAPGPWRVTAQVHGGKLQISNNLESRVVPKAQVETYLRGHGPAVMPGR
ncbi:MAG: hypothetical protein QUV07_15280 [Cyanobium sp. CZS 25K]|nr:hypothetical protein [Cyanobium sp. CZS25K]